MSSYDPPSEYDSEETPARSLESLVPVMPATDAPLLEAAKLVLTRAGFYAYLTIDQEQRWCVAADDEAGRIDILAGADGFIATICSSSPGLFMEEESEWRRQALERLARRVVPNIAQGMLAPDQSARWSAEDRGVSVCIHREIPFSEVEQLTTVIREALSELEGLLTFVESQIRS